MDDNSGINIKNVQYRNGSRIVEDNGEISNGKLAARCQTLENENEKLKKYIQHLENENIKSIQEIAARMLCVLSFAIKTIHDHESIITCFLFIYFVVHSFSFSIHMSSLVVLLSRLV